MSQGPDDDERPPNEPTFADVMNGFSLDAGRNKPKRKRWGRGPADPEVPPEQPAELTGPISGSAAYGLPPTPAELEQQQQEQAAPQPPVPPPSPSPAGGAAAVRPYAWTRGRTKSGFELAIETLVSVSGRARSQLDRLPMEHRAVADLLLEQTRSVAEVAALLSLPLGVARVLLGDMASGGTVTVHQTASTPGDVPDLALMERVLSGLRRL